MDKEAADALAQTLVAQIPREFCVALDEGFRAAAKRAYTEAASRDEGHRSSALGQGRHFQQNEAFALALDASGIRRNAIKGNGIIVGDLAPLYLARFSIANPTWNRVRKSAQRLEMARKNLWLQEIVQPGLFEATQPIEGQITVFFVTAFSGSMKVQPDVPVSIDIVVPDVSLGERLFGESLSAFLARYAEPVKQPDMAHVRLKDVAQRRQTGGSSS
jgi:hypothetical protein